MHPGPVEPTPGGIRQMIRFLEAAVENISATPHLPSKSMVGQDDKAIHHAVVDDFSAGSNVIILHFAKKRHALHWVRTVAVLVS